MHRYTKKYWLRTILAVTALILASAVACGAASGRDQDGRATPLKPTAEYNPNASLAPLVEEVAPAVVNIKATVKVKGRSGFGPNEFFEFFFGPRGRSPGGQPMERKKEAVGSGFIIDKKGLVVTNHHVIENAVEIEVQLADDRTFEAEMVGSDKQTDVALLKLKNAKGLPTVPMGDSEAIRVGDHVVAIGNPFGLAHTVTSGIVSAKERVIFAGPFDNFIQTDASINPGNSGGPLFNLSGEVIGINTAIAPQGQGIGFAIPSNMALDIVDALSGGGKVVRGWLGVSFQPLDASLAKGFGMNHKGGAVVNNVTKDSPAENGGMKTGDVIIAVNGKKLKAGRQLPTMVAKLKPGSEASIKVVRSGKKKSLKIKIGKRPDNPDASGSSDSAEELASDLKISVKDLDDDTRQRLGARDLTGVVVANVESDSPAAGYLQVGDIIVELNRDRIRNASEFQAKTKNLKSGDDVLMLIYKRGGWRYLTFRLK